MDALSPIHVLPVTHAQDQDDSIGIPQMADHAVIADPVAPHGRLALVGGHGFPFHARIVRQGLQEGDDSLSRLPGEFL